jgi:hypothetical protein
VKCRLFVKQIERQERSTREQEQQERQQKLEEQKIAQQEKQDQELVDQMSELNLMEEIQRCREEMGGPFFNKREN